MDLTPNWEFVADTVMGGVSSGRVRREDVAGRPAARLTGAVSLENNGGFVQMASDLGGGALDASDWSGVEIDVFGNGETYDLRLRTDDLTRPWQSYRTEFTAGPAWETLRLPFDVFEANKTEAAFDPARLRRVGVLAVGRVMQADVAVGGLRLWR